MDKRGKSKETGISLTINVDTDRDSIESIEWFRSEIKDLREVIKKEVGDLVKEVRNVRKRSLKNAERKERNWERRIGWRKT